MKVLLLGGNEYSFELKTWLEEIGEEVIYMEEPIDLELLKNINPEFIVSYNYKHIIPEEVIKSYHPKIVNLHVSYLPYNRGAHPNVWSFLEDTPKGVSIHLVNKEIDTGDILLQKEVFIDEDKETLRSSYIKLQREIQKLFKDNWDSIKSLKIKPFKQHGGGQSTIRENTNSLNPSLQRVGTHLSKNLKSDIRLGKVLLKNFVNLTQEEKEMVRRWRNHPEVRKWMYTDHEISKEEHEEFIESLKKDKRNYYYLVYKGKDPIGVLTLTRVDFRNHNAYFGIYANPEEKVHGAGIALGKSAIALAFDVACCIL
ncbi:MAG: UDP-4-amino-4,6-dideoxy-N-acetyl-beta-L-altrosamine N-acetyltransferase [Aquificaceae bacterium]